MNNIPKSSSVAALPISTLVGVFYNSMLTVTKVTFNTKIPAGSLWLT